MSFAIYGMTKLSLDERGRFGVPTRYREELRNRSDGKVWMTKPPEPSETRLLIYPVPAWRDVESRLLRLDTSQKIVRYVQRRVMGSATEAELDGNGRVLVPQVLREYADLDKNLVLVGLGNRFELWADAIWREAMSNGDEEYADMGDLGFRY